MCFSVNCAEAQIQKTIIRYVGKIAIEYIIDYSIKLLFSSGNSGNLSKNWQMTNVTDINGNSKFYAVNDCFKKFTYTFYQDGHYEVRTCSGAVEDRGTWILTNDIDLTMKSYTAGVFYYTIYKLSYDTFIFDQHTNGSFERITFRKR
jgi:hypothetical protein